MDKGHTISTSAEDVNLIIKSTSFWKNNNGIVNEERILPKYDAVNHPKHYSSLIFPEVIDMMTAFFTKDEVLSFCKLNAFKYRMRCGNKSVDTIAEDIAKAMWYENKYKELTAIALNPQQIIKG